MRSSLLDLQNAATTLFNRANTENWAGSHSPERQARSVMAELLRELLTQSTEVNFLAITEDAIEAKKETLILILHGLLELLADFPLKQTFGVKLLRELYPAYFTGLLLKGNQLVKQWQLPGIPTGSVFVSSTSTNTGSHSFEHLLKSLAVHARTIFDSFGGLDAANIQYANALTELLSSESNTLVADAHNIIKNTLNLAAIYRRAHQFDKALVLYQQVLPLQLKANVSGLEIAYTLNLLGFCCFSLEKYELSEKYFRDALARLCSDASNSSRRALTLFYLAEIMMRIGNKCEDAKNYYTGVLQIIQKDSSIISSIDMARLYLGLGKANEMLGQHPNILLENYRNALTYSADYQNETRIEIETRVANTLFSLGQYDSAGRHFEKALLIARKVSQNPMESIWAQIGFANTVLALGHPKQAKRYYEAILDLLDDNESDILAIVLTHYANLHIELAEHRVAQQLLHRALSLGKTHCGEDSPAVATTLYYLGNCCIAQGNFQAAETHLGKSLQIKAQHYGTAHPKYALTLRAIAWVHQAQRKYHVALTEMQAAHDIFVASNIPQQQATAKELAEIRRLLDRTNQPRSRLAFLFATPAPRGNTTDDRGNNSRLNPNSSGSG